MDKLTESYNVAAYIADKAAPYLQRARTALKIINEPLVGTAGVDTSWRLYINPEFFCAKSPKQAAYILLHEYAGHLLGKHAERAAALGITEYDKESWHKACELEINSHVWDGTEFPPDGLTPEKFGFQRGLIAESYFKLFKAKEQKDRQGQGQGNKTQGKGGSGGSEPISGSVQGSNGSGTDNIFRPWELPIEEKGKEGLSKADQLSVLYGTAQDIREAGIGCGSNHLKVWANGLTASRVTWLTKIKAGIDKGSNKIGLGKQTYNRVRIRNGVCFPRHIKKIPKIILVVDTSGSMTMGNRMQKALNSVLGIARQCGEIDVIWNDTEATLQKHVRTVNDLKPIGGGGTDMRIGIAAAEKLKPEVIITITDGETRWPMVPTKAKHIAVICKDCGNGPLFGLTVKAQVN